MTNHEKEENGQKPPQDIVQETPETMAGLSYEAALAALESVVTRLESGDVTLDESMKLFERGTALAKICAARLEAIEHQITQLLEKADGTVEEKPFGDDA
ncbi:MAG: exodeoxyribonuclease VII small subunit [Bacillota bacterium]|nr:exodeoxyribonuclease VII small subunit [Bacillota bacterium]